MITEDDEWSRIEREIKRRAAQEPSMTTLRQAAQQALEALREFGYHGSSPRWERTANALKTALEQPEPDLIPQDKLFVCGQMGANITRVTAQPEQVDCPRCGHVCSQREWQGLTDDDWEKVANRKNTVLDTFEQGATWAAYKLEKRNT